MVMDGSIGHSRQEESMEEKTRWFLSLSIKDRIEMLCSLTDIALTITPGIQDHRNVKSITGRVQILSKEDLIASKKAAGREIDLSDVHLLELPIEDAEPL